MLSVAKLTRGQEAYYEQAVASGLDDYYAGRGESPGVWCGSGADELGLVGVVGDGQLGGLLSGVDPAGGRELRAPVAERSVSVERLDPATGERRVEEKTLSAVTGFDLVFSCPKSVSLLHALTDDDWVRPAVSEAHESAWRAALGYLEAEACVVRRGHGGVLREQGAGFVAAAFRHRTSRAQDPHLHTHVVVANLARTQDGEWRALDGWAILSTYRLAAGYLYEAQLRYELARSLGVAWTRPEKGMAELVGVPEAVLRAFSTRRAQLVEHLEAHGLGGFAAARVAALATRERKETVDLDELRERWRARAAELGLGPRELAALAGLVSQPAPAFEALSSGLLGPGGMTARQTTFSQPELVCAVANSHVAGAPADDRCGSPARSRALPGIRLVTDGEVPGQPARFTTDELLAVEQAALAAAEDSSGRVPVIDPIQAALAAIRVEPRLSYRAATPRPGSGYERPACGVRDRPRRRRQDQRTCARSATRTARRAWQCSARRRAGARRTSWRAPRALRPRPFTGCSSTPSGAGAAAGVPQGCVVIVDEAGMAETRILAPLIEAVRRAEGKLVLVGDPAQLPAVGAGGMFAALCDRHGAVELVDNHRQFDLDERRALRDLRDGRARAVPGVGRATGPPSRRRRTRRAGPARRGLVAGRRSRSQRKRHARVPARRRRELNTAARVLLRGAGRIEPDALTQTAGRTPSATASCVATTTSGSACTTAPARRSSVSTPISAEPPDR